MSSPTKPFKKIGEIGRGKFANVYRVRTAADLICAGKLIKLPVQLGESDNGEKLRGLVEENKKLKDLQHRNLVKIIDLLILYNQATVAVLMDLIDGCTLAAHLKENGALSDDRIRSYSGQICSGLAYMHENGVIHRNINSSTVMITDGQLIKLVDFGLSIQLLDATSAQSSGCPRGHPQYMAPEIFSPDENASNCVYSRGSDIWAFGCVVFEMATVKKPHSECRTMLAIVDQVSDQGAPKLPETCSDDLKSFYARCVVRNRHERAPAIDLLQDKFIIQEESKAATEVLKLSASNPTEAYNMQGLKGLCLIISADVSENTARVRTTFKRLGFKVKSLQDASCGVIWQFLHNLTSDTEEISGIGCLVCFVLARGTIGLIQAKAGDEIEIRDVVARFLSGQCPTLKEKPKLFFFEVEINECFAKEGELQSEDYSFRLREKDVMVCCGTRNGKSSFVRTLCDIIETEEFRQEDIESIVSEANRSLGLEPLRTVESRCCSALSETTSRLSKKCFLNFMSVDRVANLPESSEKWTDAQLAMECELAHGVTKTYGPMQQTLLMVAAIKGHDEVFCQLLKQLPLTSLSAQDVGGMTAISWASFKGHDSILATLQNVYQNDPDTLKAEVNLSDNLRRTPIIMAARNNQHSLIKRLATMGADVNSKDSINCTAFMFAAKLGLVRTAEELLQNGANPRINDFSDNSPLIWAGRFGHTEIIQLLASWVPDVAFWRHKGEQKMNANEWATLCGRIDCAVLIEEIIQNLVKSTNIETIGPETSGGPDDPSGSSPGLRSAGSGGTSGASGGDVGASGQPGGSGDDPGGNASLPTESAYSMTKSNRRIAIIINNQDFPRHLNLPRRDGSMSDMHEAKLYQCVTRLGFDCNLFINVTSTFFRSYLDCVCSDEQLQACDAFLLCIMSHGELDIIYGTDGFKVLLEDIFFPVRLRRELYGKPKIFIVQACRDISEDRLVSRAVDNANTRKHEDCLYLYSVVSGGLSMRNVASGGLFTEVLCDVILKEFDQAKEEFLSIMPTVVNKVCKNSGYSQVPCYTSTLRKLLKFSHAGCVTGSSA